MKIKKMLSQHRRDFTATMVCEHCAHEQKLSGGYDDAYYHNSVIPNMTCDSCGKKANDTYVPRETKYAAHEIV